nr:MAG TPA: hypothetical protein [Caudoviricetes sp.]
MAGRCIQHLRYSSMRVCREPFPTSFAFITISYLLLHYTTITTHCNQLPHILYYYNK